MFGENHAAADPALDCRGLVEREVDAGMVAQELQYLLVAFVVARRRLPGLNACLPATATGFPLSAWRKRREIVLMRSRFGPIHFGARRAHERSRGGKRMLCDACEF